MSGAALIVDANVFVAMFSGESGAADWRKSIAGLTLCAPRTARLECAIAFSRKVRRGFMTSSQAIAAMALVDTLGVDWSELDDATIDRAISLSLEIGHEVADCVYLSIARDLKFEIVTRDRKLAAAAERCGVRAFAPGIA